MGERVTSERLRNVATTQSEDPNERVNHPRHYNQHPSGVECIELIEHLPCNLANAIKYVWRCGLKTSEDPLRDLRSARWYVAREKQRCGAKPDTLALPLIVLRLARAVVDVDRSALLARWLECLCTGDLELWLYELDVQIAELQRLGERR